MIHFTYLSSLFEKNFANGIVCVCFTDHSRMVMDQNEDFIQNYQNMSQKTDEYKKLIATKKLIFQL